MLSKILVLFVIVAAVNAATWEPFVAKVRRTTRTVDNNGTVVNVRSYEDTYMRSHNGSLRREVRVIENGGVLPDPVKVELTMADTRQIYLLDLKKRRAELVNDRSNDVERLYRDSLANRNPAQTHKGIPCAPVKLQFMYQPTGQITAEGSSCRAIGYGISIHERAVFPAPSGNGQVFWETDLVEFKRNTDPEADAMQVPSDFEVLKVQGGSRCSTCAITP